MALTSEPLVARCRASRIVGSQDKVRSEVVGTGNGDAPGCGNQAARVPKLAEGCVRRLR